MVDIVLHADFGCVCIKGRGCVAWIIEVMDCADTVDLVSEVKCQRVKQVCQKALCALETVLRIY